MNKVFPFLAIFLLQSLLYGQIYDCDTVFPSSSISPILFELEDEPVNFPLQMPEPAGDINGDGFGDLIFAVNAADERTSIVSDYVSKSLITYDTGYNTNSTVFYDKHFKALGDFDGDGYDDVYDIIHNAVHFGSPEGVSGDSLALHFPPTLTEFAFPGDLDNDGMSEIFIGKGSGSTDSMHVFMGNDTVPYMMTPGYLFNSVDKMIFMGHDYDSDGDTEVCIIVKDYVEDRFIAKWFYFDTENHQIQLEYTGFYNYINEPSIRILSDINGDGYKDLTHTYYYYNENDSVYGFNLEVCFGQAEEPYFSDSQTIEILNKNRLFYNAGDFNGDGADDWYSIAAPDTLVFYYGNPNVAEQGFQKVCYFTGDGQFLLPKSDKYGNYAMTSDDMKVFDYNNDSVEDLFFYYWTYDENLQYDFVGTAIVTGGNSPDFLDPIPVGRSGDKSYKAHGYGYLTKNIGDFNGDGYDDWGTLAKYGCYLDIFFGGETIDLLPDVKYLLPQTNLAWSFDWSVGDVNGDGLLDVVISNSSRGSVAFMRGCIPQREEVYVFFGEQILQGVYNFEDADVIISDTDHTFREFGLYLGVVGDYNA
ncbi:MAG: hypothetical protein DRJ05_11810, partial [Bacteroidetes bacterium]